MNKANNKNYTFPLIIIGSLFFILGFITWLNGMLIPYLKTACELSNVQALYVTFAFYISYTIMALPSSMVLNRIGFKNGMSVGLWLMALGAVLFIPAAYTRLYGVFLLGLFVLGSGMALLQTAVNPYVTILGPIESAAKRISIMGIANKVAGALAPLVLAFFVINAEDDAIMANMGNMSLEAKTEFLDTLALRVVNPYIAMAVILLVLGLLIRSFNLPKVQDTEKNTAAKEQSRFNLFDYPQLYLGVIALFLYVGVEVIAGDTIIQYGKSLNLPSSQTKAFTTYTMSAMLLGYVLGIFFIPKYISQNKALKISALLGLALTLLTVFSSGAISVVFIALLGLANALVWPAVWPLALNNLGDFIPKASALLIMAISGGALLPLLWGKLSEVFNPQQAYWIMFPAYLFIYYYAVKGHKITKK